MFLAKSLTCFFKMKTLIRSDAPYTTNIIPTIMIATAVEVIGWKIITQPETTEIRFIKVEAVKAELEISRKARVMRILIKLEMTT